MTGRARRDKHENDKEDKHSPGGSYRKPRYYRKKQTLKYSMSKTTKKKSSDEQSLVDCFYEAYRQTFAFKTYQTRGGKSPKPDVSFEGELDGNKRFFVLEAKRYNENNRSNYPKQILTEILINRHCCEVDKGFCHGKNKASYGFLIPCFPDGNGDVKPDGIYNFWEEHLLSSDWNAFGEKYDCEYVFLFNEESKTLHYRVWKDFLENKDWKLSSIPNDKSK